MVAAWIFVLSPPRERPKAWSPPFFLVLLPRAGGLVPLWSPSTDDGLGRSIRTEAAAKAGAILPALPSVEIACKLRASSPEDATAIYEIVMSKMQALESESNPGEERKGPDKLDLGELLERLARSQAPGHSDDSTVAQAKRSD